jgi:hypothetical protein
MTAISRFSSIFITLVLLSFSSVSHADIIFDNFGPGFSFPDVGRILQGELVGNIANIDQAASFTTGPNGAFVTDVKLAFMSVRLLIRHSMGAARWMSSSPAMQAVCLVLR